MGLPVLPHSHRSVPGATDDVVLKGMPADVPHTGVMARQSGHHAARQDVVNDDLSSGAAGVDEPLSGAELGGEAAADECVQDAVAAVRHHRSVAREFVFL